MRLLLQIAVIVTSCQVAMAQPPAVPVGDGSYLDGRPPGASGPPETAYITPAVNGPLPTNDWWSSLAWMPFSERHYPHPLAVQAEPGGLRIAYPGNRITATPAAIFGFMLPNSPEDVVIGHSGQDTFADARVDGFSDWFVRVKFGSGERSMTVAYGHGSPYVFARFEGGTPKLTFPTAPRIWSGDRGNPTLGLTIQGRHYGVFAPRGATWQGWDSEALVCETNRGYCSIAILPNDDPRTLELFARHAHNHVTESRVTPSYDVESATVTTRFTVVTEAMEGDSAGTLLALYPHQWKYTNAELLALEYGSVRGRMRLVGGDSFETRHRYPGVLPGLPEVGGCDPRLIATLLAAESKVDDPAVRDTYWDGKYLGKLASLIPIADAYDQSALAGRLRAKLAGRLEAWLTARTPSGNKANQLFWYDQRWGTLVGHPGSYGSADDLNDHHFHYGYLPLT